MPEVNWIAVGLCAVSSLVLGGLWYSPALFARQWQTAAGLSDEQARSGNMHGLKLAGIDLDRKVLADIAMHESEAFTAIIAQAKAALPQAA